MSLTKLSERCVHSSIWIYVATELLYRTGVVLVAMGGMACTDRLSICGACNSVSSWDYGVNE